MSPEQQSPTHQATSTTQAGARIAAALRRSKAEQPALISYIVAGAPSKQRFEETLLSAASASDVLEIGLPFSDPVADGPVIAAAGRAAIERGVCLTWLLDLLTSLGERPKAPLVLMTYLNPLFALGLERSIRGLARAGIEGLIVPDLPLEESGPMRELCDAQGVALVQLVAPTTPPERILKLAQASRGFLYAVTRTGITGARTSIESVRAHLKSVRCASPLPVAAGFGIRDADQVADLSGIVDAAVVGTALVEAISRAENPAHFLDSLRPPKTSLPPTNPAPKAPIGSPRVAPS